MQKNKRYIFFYSHLDRHFRSTLIGHLYLLMEHHDVIIFSDNLKNETLSILSDTNLFPRLKIINLHNSDSKNFFIKNLSDFQHNTKIFDQFFEKYHCKALIASSDWHSLNELYLMRCAKKKEIFRFSIQESAHWNTQFKKELFLNEKRASYPQYFPFKKLITKIFLLLKYFYFQILIPIFTFRKPFLMRQTYFLWNGAAGCNYSEYHLVFSSFEYEQYKISGTEINKLKIIPHPFTFNRLAPLKNVLFKSSYQKIDFLILLDNITLLFQNNKKLISKRKIFNHNLDIIEHLAKRFPNQKIVIKPHPDATDTTFLKNKLERYKNVDFVDKSLNVECFFEITETIIGIYPAFSTSSIYFKLFYPNKKSIVINLFNDYYGYFFENNKYGVKYVKSKEELDLVIADNQQVPNSLNSKFSFNDINQFLDEKLN